jgi:hypothetical protein
VVSGFVLFLFLDEKQVEEVEGGEHKCEGLRYPGNTIETEEEVKKKKKKSS